MQSFNDWCCPCYVGSACVHYLLCVRSIKSKKHNDWFRSSAKAMDLILDESLYPNWDHNVVYMHTHMRAHTHTHSNVCASSRLLTRTLLQSYTCLAAMSCLFSFTLKFFSIKDEGSTSEQRRQQARISQLKDQLDLLLQKPLLPVGFSLSYPTFGGHNLATSMLNINTPLYHKEESHSEREGKTLYMLNE